MTSINDFNFSYFWKLDDVEWMKKRKDEWNFIAEKNYSELSSKSLKNYMDFYIRGEKKDYIGENIEFLFIPYDSAECARKVFYSNFFTVNCRKGIFGNFLSIASTRGLGLPWLSQHIKWYSEGVLGGSYRIIEEMDGRIKKVISPEPTFWCGQYIARALDFIQERSVYHGVIECVDYFVSAISFVDRKDIELSQLIDCVNEALNSNSAPVNVMNFVRELKGNELKLMERLASD